MTLACSAQADSLITNGSFESTVGTGQIGFSGTVLNGWTSTNNNNNAYNFIFTSGSADTSGEDGQYGTLKLWGPNDGSANGLPASSPDGGNFIAADGDFQNGAIQQTISNLTLGATYNVSFYWAASQQQGFDGDTQQYWAVSLGAETLDTATYDLPSHGFSGWMSQTMSFTADSTTDVLSFLAVGNLPVPPFLLLDGVSMSSATPEPGSVALMLGGLLVGLGLVRSKKRAKK
jgi:hypothetical protein